MLKTITTYSDFLFTNFNSIVLTSIFPEQLKSADVKAVFKKDSRNNKKNYRPVKILSNNSKVYYRLLYSLFKTYFESVLSKYQCGFRKGFRVLSTLLPVIFFSLGFTPSKAEQPLQGMQLQERETQKD